MDIDDRPTLRPLRITRPRSTGDFNGSVPEVPERVPTRNVASDRSSATESSRLSEARSRMREAYAELEEVLDGKLTHRSMCSGETYIEGTGEGPHCSCGFLGFNRYLGR